jgi:dynein heavy chain
MDRPGTAPPGRQRGFYSEILDAEMEPENQLQLLQAASCGPRSLDLQPKLSAPKQRMPLAKQFRGMSEEAHAAATKRMRMKTRAASAASAPSRALEPKVLVPFNPGPGRTPRRIVIERQKRLFALQDLTQVHAPPCGCEL